MNDGVLSDVLTIIVIIVIVNVSIKERFNNVWSYLIFVIFFTLAKFLENKIYTEKRQFSALNL